MRLSRWQPWRKSQNGKAYTDFADNFDLVIADNAARVFQANKKVLWAY